MLSEAKKIIDESADFFCDCINRVNEIGPYKRKDPVSFEIFHPTNDEYNRYKYMERILEWYIREYYVNRTIAALFKLRGKKVWWPNTVGNLYSGLSNEKKEDVWDFEFISIVDEKRVLYRFTDLCLEDVKLDAFLKAYEVDHVEVIDWSESVEKKISWGVSEGKRDKVLQISLQKLFIDHFSEEEYKYFVKKGQEAVETANEDIGFQTIPKLSLRNLSEFKHDILLDIMEKDYPNLRYEIIESTHYDDESRRKAERNARRRLNDSDQTIVMDNFVNKKLYTALVGKEEYAKCFITSEYMFHIFRGGGFEYTTVVCGYLKSIEQLAKKLLDVTVKNYPNAELWIKKNNNRDRISQSELRSNPVTRKTQVRVKESNKNWFDLTLAPLMWFLHDNETGWNVSDSARRTIHGYLENYTSECRNEHFHKDNIYNWESVKKIRNNTILLMYLLIGGYKISDNSVSVPEDIGAIDYSFDNLYRKIKKIPKGVNKFSVQFAGREKQKLIRLSNQERTVYSDGGFLDKARIVFAIVDSYRIDDNEKFEKSLKTEQKLVLNADNVPERMWFVKGDGEEEEIIW